MFKTGPTYTGAVRNGYTTDQLYRILKMVLMYPEINSYSNVLLESLALFNDFNTKNNFKIPIWIIQTQIKRKFI